MKTLKELVADAKTRLASAGVDSPDVDAEWLVAGILGLRRQDLKLDPDRTANIEDCAAVGEAVSRRENREPLAYILGTSNFRGLWLGVGPGVLCPRPETEITVERAIERAHESSQNGARPTIVDVGTGCGAIALSIAAEAPEARVYAIEISPTARGWALRNLAETGLRVTLLPGSLLSPLHPALGANCDLIVANLPYLSEDEYHQVPPELRFEPKDALVAGPTGLEAIIDLIEQAEHWLAHAGWLVLEIGETQSEDVVRFMHARGYREIKVTKDLAGRDRVVEGRWTTLI